MTRKNPYENQDETIDIPDFVEDKTKTESSTVDMSIFKMSDDELYDDVDETLENEDGEYVPRKKSTALVLSMIINFILLAACIGAIVYALNQHKAYVKANTENQQITASQEVLKQQINERDQTIEQLNKQIEDLQKAKESTASGKYRIVDGPVTFRSTPTKNTDPSNATTYQGKSEASDGDEYDVIEVVEDKDLHDQLYWAKVDDNVYFCIGNQKDDIWAKKVD
jgi:hypothetical protein